MVKKEEGHEEKMKSETKNQKQRTANMRYKTLRRLQ